MSRYMCIIIKYSTHELQETSRNEETEAMAHFFKNVDAIE